MVRQSSPALVTVWNKGASRISPKIPVGKSDAEAVKNIWGHAFGVPAALTVPREEVSA